MSFIKYESRRYRLHGITELLGSQPASEAIRSEYVASKAPLKEQADEEGEMLKLEEKGLTVFLRDKEDNLVMQDYQIRAYFKGALDAMSDQLGVLNIRHKIDVFMHVRPRNIILMRDGKPIKDEDGYLERSLRASTPRGPMTALASSEKINEGWYIDIQVCLLKNSPTAKSANITWDTIEDALCYGEFQGLGQWRSGSYGRFTFERMPDTEEDAQRIAQQEAELDKRLKAEAARQKKTGRPAKAKAEADE